MSGRSGFYELERVNEVDQVKANRPFVICPLLYEINVSRECRSNSDKRQTNYQHYAILPVNLPQCFSSGSHWRS
jgi:hypothetical protein